MANKFLGIGADMKPGLYSQANSLAEYATKIKAMVSLHAKNLRLTLEQARDIGMELAAAKERCICEYKPWLEWLGTTGIGERSAQNYMRVATYWTKLVAHPSFIAGLGMSDALKVLSASPPAVQSETKPGNNEAAGHAPEGPAAGGKRSSREPGDDRPPIIVQIERAFASIETRAKEIIKVHEVPDSEAQRAIAQIQAGIDMLKRFHEAPEREFKVPFKKPCKDCHAELLFAQTSKHNWVVLDAEPGQGTWKIEGNVARKTAFDFRVRSEFYRHHDCPKKKGPIQ